VKRLEKSEYGGLLSAGSGIASVLATIGLLWFIRRYAFNATNAGWGDQAQDRHQALLGWGVRISAVVVLVSIAATAIRSRRALISIATGTALSGLAGLIVYWLPTVGWVFAFPGILVALYAFGIHYDGYGVVAYRLIINAWVYSGVAFLLLRKRTAR
jgi:hypothetical protein